MKFKKFMAAALATVISLSGVAAFAKEGDENRVEISFKVGDDTLLINGESVTVEKPFVVGEGTTLVPIRVITEAFGAKVDWINDTQTVTLEYPDVSISLQIGNSVATVNDHTETLPEAPVLTENGFTMVPLRFISETFGAVVTYDGETEAITVVKESTSGSILEGMTQKAKVGDSYYGWTMNTPKDFIMSESYFDGTYISFTDNYNNVLSISIHPLDKDLEFDSYFSEIKTIFSTATLTKADKPKDQHGNTYMHFGAKSNGETIDHKIWLTDNYEISVLCIISTESTNEAKNNCLSISNSFDIAGTFDNTVYDLSDVENGYRQFEDKNYKVSFNLPANLGKDELNESENTFIFYESTSEDTTSTVKLAIYSIDENATAKELAEHDRASHAKYKPQTYTTVSAVSPMKIGAHEGYAYTITIKNSGKHDVSIKDMFFDLGDYVYNLSVIIPNGKTNFTDELVASFKAEALDKAEIGSLLRNDYDQVQRTVKTDLWSISVPNSWIDIDQGGSIILSSIFTDAIATVYVDTLTTTPSTTQFRRQVENMVANNPNMTIVEQPKTIGSSTLKAVIREVTSDGKVAYNTIYQTSSGKKTAVFLLVESDIYYSGAVDTEFELIVKSFKFI